MSLKTVVNPAIIMQMDVFIAESKSFHLSEAHLKRAASLRAQIESLHSQIQRDGFVLEQLSLKTKTPYVQLTLTKRLLDVAQDGSSPGSTSIESTVTTSAAAGFTTSSAGGGDCTTTGAGTAVARS